MLVRENSRSAMMTSKESPENLRLELTKSSGKAIRDAISLARAGACGSLIEWKGAKLRSKGQPKAAEESPVREFHV